MNAVLVKLFQVSEPIIFTTYFRATFALFSIFIIFVLFGFLKKHYFRLRMEGASFGFLLGVLSVLAIETIAVVLILFGHKTFGIFSENKGVVDVADLARGRVVELNQVLGITVCPQITPSSTMILEQLPNLSKSEENRVKEVICH